MNYIFYAICLVLVGIWAGYFLALLIERPAFSGKVTTVAIETPQAIEESTVEIDDFTVTGKPRKPTWRQRRKELEAAARTKRKRLEEWRD